MDLEQLSAKQLFELANKKLRQEQQAAQRAEMAARSSALQRRGQQIIAEHERALAVLDREFLALKQRRDQLVVEHQRQLESIERELASIVHPPEPPADPRAEQRAIPTTTDTGATSRTDPLPPPHPRSAPEEEIASAIIQALTGRSDMSDSLLREKLRIRGLPLGNLSKQLEKMARDGTIFNRGGGNYSLKKKP